MKKRKLLVRKMAHNVRQVNHDLRFEYGVAPHADREMTTLEKKLWDAHAAAAWFPRRHAAGDG